MDDAALAEWLREELPEWKRNAPYCTDPTIDDILDALTALVALLREAKGRLNNVQRFRKVLKPADLEFLARLRVVFGEG